MSGGATPAGAEDEHTHALQHLINGFQISQAIYVVAELGIPDLLADAPPGSDELAVRARCDPDALYRLMRALAAAGVLTEAEGRVFALNPLGGGLRSDAAVSRDAWVRFALGPPHWAAWGAMLHTVRTERMRSATRTGWMSGRIGRPMPPTGCCSTKPCASVRSAWRRHC